MPKPLLQYRIFIASPGGLDDERRSFRARLLRFSEIHGEHLGAVFHPVAWEDRIGGVGRPQAIINEDLKQCDYAMFVLHDRWGTPPGRGYSSGTAEEWDLAEQLYKANKIRNIALFFRDVDPAKLRDPGPQLTAVLEFKRRIEAEKKYFAKSYSTVEQFADMLEGYLAQWLRDHSGAAGNASSTGPASLVAAPRTPNAAAGPGTAPGFSYWIDQAARLMEGGTPDYAAALFCADRAAAAANSDVDWAWARQQWAVAQFKLTKPDEAISAFDDVADRLSAATSPEGRRQVAMALLNKGLTLSAIGRRAEAIAAYDDLLARFGAAQDLPVRERLADALFSKGVALRALGRSAEEIAAFDDLLARFGAARELRLRAWVAKTLRNKGMRLGELGRSADALAALDELLARFGAAAELPLREQVAQALVNKGVRLSELGRSREEIAVYDDLISRFGAAPELLFREQVASALFNKGITLSELGRSREAFAAYDDLLSRFGAAPEPALQQMSDAARRRRDKLG